MYARSHIRVPVRADSRVQVRVYVCRDQLRLVKLNSGSKVAMLSLMVQHLQPRIHCAVCDYVR